MKPHNLKDLESLSLFCNFGGMIIVFLGVVIGFMNILSNEIKHIQGAVFIFISGYALIKISAKINRIVQEERANKTGY